IEDLDANGWLPVPRDPLPFASTVAASRNDPLGRFDRVTALARAWGSRLVDLGEVGHLNPASGYGDWPQADALIANLSGVIGARQQRDRHDFQLHGDRPGRITTSDRGQ